jgi:hypothetical protein
VLYAHIGALTQELETANQIAKKVTAECRQILFYFGTELAKEELDAFIYDRLEDLQLSYHPGLKDALADIMETLVKVKSGADI